MNFAAVQTSPNGVALVCPQLQSERQVLDRDRVPEGVQAFCPVGPAADFVLQSSVHSFLSLFSRKGSITSANRSSPNYSAFFEAHALACGVRSLRGPKS